MFTSHLAGNIRVLPSETTRKLAGARRRRARDVIFLAVFLSCLFPSVYFYSLFVLRLYIFPLPVPVAYADPLRRLITENRKSTIKSCCCRKPDLITAAICESNYGSFTDSVRELIATRFYLDFRSGFPVIFARDLGFPISR